MKLKLSVVSQLHNCPSYIGRKQRNTEVVSLPSFGKCILRIFGNDFLNIFIDVVDVLCATLMPEVFQLVEIAL